MVDLGRPYRASYLVSGVEAEKVFAALLDVDSFPKWAVGLRHARVLDPAGGAGDVRPGANLEFTLSAAGLTHKVLSTITVVEHPHRLEWRYKEGVAGSEGWPVEQEGPETVRMTLTTDYEVSPAWLNAIAHRPFFRGLTEDLIRRSIRRFEEHLKQPRSSGTNTLL